MSNPNASKRGPKPKLELTQHLLDQLRGLGGIQATVEECAAVLKVSLRTLQNFFTDHPEAKEAHEDGKENGKTSLRRAQFALALNGNATMQIWLGKQMLGQREPVTQIEAGRPGDFSLLSDQELNTLIAEQAQEVLAIEHEEAPKGARSRTKH